MTKTFEFHVEMTCEGCVNAVKRILEKHKGQGVEDYQIDLSAQKVTIQGTLDEEAMTAIIGKCGKDVELKSVKD